MMAIAVINTPIAVYVPNVFAMLILHKLNKIEIVLILDLFRMNILALDMNGPMLILLMDIVIQFIIL